jgi:hypothetical protein
MTAQAGVLELVRKAQKFETTINAESLKAARISCMEIKVAWLRIAASEAHLSSGSRIGAGNGVKTKTGKIGRGTGKWGVRYSVNGKSRLTTQALVGFTGPVHLVFHPTKPHFMGAKRTNGESVGKYRSAAWGGIEGRVRRGRELNEAFGGSSVKGAMGSYRSAGRTIARGKNAGKYISHGARALNIGGTGASLRPYAFHPGTKGHGTVWPSCLAAATQIVPRGFADANRKGLIAAGFGAATSTGKAIIAA